MRSSRRRRLPWVPFEVLLLFALYVAAIVYGDLYLYGYF